MFDKNPKTTDAERFIAGKTTEQVVRALLSGTFDGSPIPDGTLQALVDRFDRKADRRATKAA